MKRALRLFVFALMTATVVVVVDATPALAESSVTAAVDESTIELGDSITYSLQANSTDGSPSDPQPGPHPGFGLRHVATAPTHMVQIINGVRTERHGLSATWTLRAEKVGTFTLGPASVAVPGGRRAAQPVRVNVVPLGKAPQRNRRGNVPVDPFGGSPFDPFGGGGLPFDPFRGLLGDDDAAHAMPQVPTDPALALETPRAPTAFLHAKVDRGRAVVGEQVTLSIYLYAEPGTRLGRPQDVHVPAANDFIKHTLKEGGNGERFAMVGGRPWSVELISRDALFPLKTGKLPVGSLALTFSNPQVGYRESEPLTVDVVEPPLAGRPAGYSIGDVGDFSLQATVTPRTAERDGSVGVTVELRGTGNLPAQITMPTVPGVEWLDAQVRDDLGAAQTERFGGARTFAYVGRLHREGAVDLGEVRLPFYNPQTRAYAVARASLGIVDVAKGAARDAGVAEVEPVLVDLPPARDALERPAPQAYLDERPIYWGALFGSPLAVALGMAAHGAARRIAERRAKASPSNERVAKDRRAEADAACRGDDGATAMAAVARAVEADVLARVGVNVRGVAGDDLARELENAGVSAEAAGQVVGVLRTCEAARFSPDGVSVEVARSAWTNAREVLDRIGASDGRRGSARSRAGASTRGEEVA